jgi:hypothetical protein
MTGTTPVDQQQAPDLCGCLFAVGTMCDLHNEIIPRSVYYFAMLFTMFDAGVILCIREARST